MTSTPTSPQAHTVVGGILAWHLARAGHPVHIADAVIGPAPRRSDRS